MSRLVLRSFLVLSSALVLAGCPQPPANPDREACEHLEKGPATAVTAVATGDGPLIATDHRRYDVTLVPVTQGNGGRVRFTASRAGDHVFFLGANIPVTFTTAAGAAVAIEKSQTSGMPCAAMHAKHTVPMAVGSYHVSFGPTPAASIAVVVEAGAH